VQYDATKRLQLWDKLAGADSAAASKATWELAADPSGTVAFLKTKLQPLTVPPAQEIASLIANLGSETYSKRQEAQALLAKIGDPTIPALREALANRPTLEQRRRLEKLIEELDSPRLSGDRLRLFRALEVLEHIATTDAQQLLIDLAKGAPTARFTREARDSLERLALP
jgi:hypothetical protein